MIPPAADLPGKSGEEALQCGDAHQRSEHCFAPTVLLAIHAVSVQASPSTAFSGEGTLLVKGVSAWFAPKTLTAIMGESGKQNDGIHPLHHHEYPLLQRGD